MMNYIQKKKKIVSVFICLILMGIIPVSVGMNNYDKIETSSLSTVILSDGGASSNTNTLRYTFAFTHPTLGTVYADNSIYTTIDIPGCISIGRDAGEPMMPVKLAKLLLPPMTTLTDINVVGNPVELASIETPIYPYQNPVPIGFEPEEFEINTDVYSSDLMYPPNIYNMYHIGYCRGYAILDITLNPVQYIPSEGRLFYYPELTVTINLEDTGELNQFFRNSPDDNAWVETLVYNPEIAGTYTIDLPTFEYPGGLCDPSDDYDYVIITTTYNSLDYWEAGGSTPYNWNSLMDKHKQDDGLRCTLVTIQDITACTDYHSSDPLFNDLQAHIREFCKDAYEDWGTQYIFIGGDDEWIPARHMKYAYESNVDSDIYWSNLDKTFNDDHDALWGEEGDLGFDLYSELFIGRITCDEPQDVSNWMTKSFYYADATDIDYLENAGFYGNQNSLEYSAIKGFETWNSNHPEMPYNLSVKWTGDSSPNPGWQVGSDGFKNAINNDHVTFISGVAHANEKMSLDVGMNSWETDYYNTKPFFIHDYGCHCGDMDAADDGVLHSMLFHSDTELAFACVYNTGYGWASYNGTNSSSALQQKLFWDYFFDLENNSGSTINWQLGKAQAWSKDSMASTINWTYSGAPGSWRGIIQGCLLFGDPAQRIKAPDFTHCYPVFNGTMGNNGWYRSCVTITFIVNGEVVYIMYNLDDGEWTEYTGPFKVCEDGYHTICWYYVDNEGNQSCPEYVDFKIDRKSPTIWLTTEKIGPNMWLFIADVYDETSGIAKVEFYVNGEYVGKATEAPYEWIYNHTPNPIGFSVRGLIFNPKITEETVSFFAIVVGGHSIFNNPVAQAIVYDNAGNYAISQIPHSPIDINFHFYIFKQLTFSNSYSGTIGRFFIDAVFEDGPL